VNQPGNQTWDYYDCAVCLLPHHSHYLRNDVEMWMMRMKMKTWDAAVAAGVTHVLM
jgi:hypothetical protein